MKSATLSSTIACASFSNMMFEAQPIVRVAIEPRHPGRLFTLSSQAMKFIFLLFLIKYFDWFCLLFLARLLLHSHGFRVFNFLKNVGMDLEACYTLHYWAILVTRVHEPELL